MTTRSSRSSKKPRWLWAGIAGVVVIALGVAILSSRGSDTAVSQGTTATDNSSSSAAETQPVTVDGAALPAPPDAGADPAIGLTPPTLQGFTFDGSPIDITPGGRAKMVVFLAHWCPHCNREIPVLQQWAAAGGVPADLDIIGVSTAVSSQRDNYPPSEWLKAKNWTWPAMADRRGVRCSACIRSRRFPDVRHHRRRWHGEGPVVGRAHGRRSRRPGEAGPRQLRPELL